MNKNMKPEELAKIGVDNLKLSVLGALKNTKAKSLRFNEITELAGIYQDGDSMIVSAIVDLLLDEDKVKWAKDKKGNITISLIEVSNGN